jgi:hypothetical protein
MDIPDVQWTIGCLKNQLNGMALTGASVHD